MKTIISIIVMLVAVGCGKSSQQHAAEEIDQLRAENRRLEKQVQDWEKMEVFWKEQFANQTAQLSIKIVLLMDELRKLDADNETLKAVEKDYNK